MQKASSRQCDRWGIFELALPGKTAGNPFTDYNIQGVFRGPGETLSVDRKSVV